jgi:hypothetical protein
MTKMAIGKKKIKIFTFHILYIKPQSINLFFHLRGIHTRQQYCVIYFDVWLIIVELLTITASFYNLLSAFSSSIYGF